MVDAYSYNLSELIKKYYKKHRTVINIVSTAALLLLVGGIYSYISINAQKVIAERNEKEAITQKGIAVEAEADAVVARDEAVVERNNAQQQLYYANIANTRFNINDEQMDKARELLADCQPEALRQWEWGHFEAVAHADMITLDRGGKFTAFTDSGNGLLAATKKGSLSLHDLSTGELIHEFVRWGGNGAAVAASDDGSRVGIRGDTAVQVWDVKTQKELIHFEESKSADGDSTYLDMSADGRYVAALNSDRSTRVWDVDSGAVVFTIEDCNLPTGFGLHFSPDGTHLLVVRQLFGDDGIEKSFRRSIGRVGEERLTSQGQHSFHPCRRLWSEKRSPGPCPR